MIYQTLPENFSPKLEAVGCFVKCNGEILLLHRQDHRPEGNTWGLPAGKIDEGEKAIDSIAREIFEETGLVIPESAILYLDKVYIKYPTYDSIFHFFETDLETQQEVTIDINEHKDFKWISPENALNLELIGDLDEAIKIFCKI
ncbi:MAG TPA: NUDIX hydrolase [Patescibacteria group bacterium]|nr:NUDIX hydrolase [Patescibacteria group bacterium]